MVIVSGVKCYKCGDFIYSRAPHDFHRCSCGTLFVDGGFERIRYGADEINLVPFLKCEVDASKKELFEDWNENVDAFGLIVEKDFVEWRK